MKQGWKIQALGDVATFINGDRSTNYPSKKDYVIDGIPFVNAGNLIQTGIDLESLNLISQSKYDSLTQGKFVEGDILFCLRGTLGKHSIVQNDLNGAIASSLVIIRAKDGFNNKYISYFLDYKQPFIERLNNGAAQPNIPAKTMKGFPILLPPNEKQQQSIVDYLDAAFAQIDELKNNAEKQLAEARALFQSALTQAMQPKPGWQQKVLDNCIDKVPKQKQVKSKDYQTSGKYPIVSQERDLISGYWDDESFLYKHERPVIIFGDHTKEIKYIDFDFVVGADGTQILSPKDDIIAKFFYYALLATPIRSLGYARHFKLLKEKSFPVPKITEQQQIVERLDALSNDICKLEEINSKTVTECDALKQAILRQIFE